MEIMLNRLITVCDETSTPFSAKVKSLITRRDWVALANLEVNPRNYQDVVTYKADSGLCALFSSNADLPTGIDRRDAALKKWWVSEQECSKINAQFSNYLSGYYPGVDGRVVEFLDRLAKRVAVILGPLPPEIQGRFGPGTTHETVGFKRIKGRGLTVVDKIQALSGTSGAQELAAWSGCRDRVTDPTYFGIQRELWTTRGSIWESVPKKATGDRAIAIEPGLNVYLQLGLEDVLWRRLNRIGIHKEHQQEKHRYLARNALKLGLATLDESMASDLWARNAVRFLLKYSPLWLSLLESVRSPVMLVEGRWVYLEKFSSMGNGFTFPLMTILFHSLLLEVCGDQATVSTFGDDLILPAEFARTVIAALRFLGHKPNESKSHYDGVFRESCGEDFFNGVPCRPHFLEKWPASPPELYSLSNGLVRRASSVPLLRFAAWVRRQIPYSLRFGGPLVYGDQVLHGHRPRFRIVDGVCYIRALKMIGRSVDCRHLDHSSLLTAALAGHGLTSRPQKGRPPRDLIATRGTSGFKAVWVSSY